MPGAIFALAVATCAIGTTDFVISGLLPGIATDLGVSIPSPGFLLNLYALAITLGISADSKSATYARKPLGCRPPKPPLPSRSLRS